jgi:hypothetical protein
LAAQPVREVAQSPPDNAVVSTGVQEQAQQIMPIKSETSPDPPASHTEGHHHPQNGSRIVPRPQQLSPQDITISTLPDGKLVGHISTKRAIEIHLCSILSKFHHAVEDAREMNGKTPLVENGHGHHNGAIDGALAGEAASKKDE